MLARLLRDALLDRRRLRKVLFADDTPRARPLLAAQVVDGRECRARILGPDAAKWRAVLIGTPLNFPPEFIQTAAAAGNEVAGGMA